MTVLCYIVLAVAVLDSATMNPPDIVDEKAHPVAKPAPESAFYGDRVTLKSGKVLQGVKVVQSTPLKLFLEVIPSVEPLEIPARQVLSIAYGQAELVAPSTPAEEPLEDDSTPDRVLQAVKISPDLAKRMATPITDKAVDFNEQDLLNTLRSVGIMGGVPVIIGPHLEKLSAEERTFSLRLEKGVSFEEFDRDTLVSLVPWLKMEYRFDTVYFERE
jgi:hypothetical protein